ncbi:HAD family hydrolase [Streptomyces sp. DSM 44915]|uniref:HAD family hydrolase n=1 Tax=Streptomyces chisholmiae TaxID=3075540 RepID=A0ABU2JPJ1_9ACTN|nr:HAD family hydrolase [Streptomyces sp. DSM 44915]MDT0266910.1 HAD family hydrolase [Streptomyces sp. DSM 44915]
MTDRRFDALLCDLDGVLRHWDTTSPPRLERAYGLPAGALTSAAFRPDRLVPAVTGQVTDEEWRAAVAADLAPACGTPERARALVEAWSDTPGSVDPVVLAMLTEVRRRVPVVLVTNATTRLESDLAALGLTEVADAIVNSARVRVAKPDPEIFRIAAERAGVPTGRCLFVDDTEGHVTAARELGMTAVWHRDNAELRRVLRPLIDV